MSRLTLNREFARRYAFSALLFAGLGGWFGYDGFMAYPRMEPAALYERIERTPPPDGLDLAAFKRQKIRAQIGLMVVFLAASAWVGLILLKAARFYFAYDETGFAVGGARHAFSDISAVDLRRWDTKDILVLRVDGRRIVLDGWHHCGVKTFEKILREKAVEMNGFFKAKEEEHGISK